MGVIVAAVLAAGMLWNTAVIIAAVALLAVGATYELIYNAAGVKEKTAVGGACVYTALAVCILLGKVLEISAETGAVQLFRDFTLIYFLFSVGLSLINHKDFSFGGIVTLAAMPPFIAYGFSCLGAVINHSSGLYYLLLMLNFSSVCDMGAYFIGSALGRHKLCPEISPKKTIEGAVGGVLCSILASVIIALCFNRISELPLLLVLTVPFCVLGMSGDLFASALKRSVGLKDYGNLIPGHGGILDRFDSMLLIAPVLYAFIMRGLI